MLEGKNGVMAAVLSLSLLTVMAGAAVAPALDVIRAHFADADIATVQMVISMPALFIALASPAFSLLAQRFSAKTLCVGALALYVGAGVGAGFVDSLPVVLAFRALVGLSVGIVMPLSTGLLAWYFPPDEQSRLMGYASAMNQLGGVVATLAAGMLAQISWRTAFLVYLMGIPCLVLCAAFVPNDRIVETRGNAGPSCGPADSGKAATVGSSCLSALRRHWPLVIAMFFLMLSFFIFPSSYAMESAREGVLPPWAVTLIMTWLDLVAFAGGLMFARLRRHLGERCRFAAPVLFAVGYAALALLGGWAGGIIGGVLIGFANGIGVPFLMTGASLAEGRRAATTVLPLLSTALYLAQFATPSVLAPARVALPEGVGHVPYLVAITAAVAFGVASAFISPTRGEKQGA